VSVSQSTSYPWDGKVEIHLDPARPRRLELRLRIPGWTRGQPVPSGLYRYLDGGGGSPILKVDGRSLPVTLEHGYAVVARTWKPGDLVTLELPMVVRRVVADERVEDDRGKVALERGPLVYCAEGVDNGGSVLDAVLPDTATVRSERRPDLLGGITVLQVKARISSGKRKRLVAVPYCVWSNRGPGEMAVWLRRSAE
jgi:DUF1680 family protein